MFLFAWLLPSEPHGCPGKLLQAWYRGSRLASFSVLDTDNESVAGIGHGCIRVVVHLVLILNAREKPFLGRGD